MKDLREDQSAALAAYAREHGRCWKRDLLADWMSGRDADHPEGHLLRQVRNTFGPSWLKTFKLEQEAL